MKNAKDFNEIVEAFGWDDIRYVGPAPRMHMYKSVWTTNEGPLSEFIYYHHEMVLVSSIILVLIVSSTMFRCWVFKVR